MRGTKARKLWLACIYALLDRSKIIRVEHFRAALALWTDCESSARYIFGDSLGDPVADTLLKALRNSANGLTLTEMRDLFGRNRGAHGDRPRLAGSAGIRTYAERP
jgi:hypothetical protein